jgi:hypothetical protein
MVSEGEAQTVPKNNVLELLMPGTVTLASQVQSQYGRTEVSVR